MKFAEADLLAQISQIAYYHLNLRVPRKLW